MTLTSRSLLTATLVCVIASVSWATEPPVQQLFQTDPMLRFPEPVFRMDPAYKPLWINALSHPESDLQREAAVAIANAHSRKLLDFSDAAEPLTALLIDPEQSEIVRLDAARALIAIDARQADDLLFQQLSAGSATMAKTVEPALADWDYEPIREVWLERLRQPNVVPRHQLQLAISGVARDRQQLAAAPLVSLATTSLMPSGLRLKAARALALIQHQDLEADAASLAEETSAKRLISRLLAASMLSGHQSEPALDLQQKLADDPEPAVAAIAWRHLLKVDADRLLPIVEKTAQRADPTLRSLAAQLMFQRPSSKNTHQLTLLLDDRHPLVRNTVRGHLVQLAADPKLQADVISEAMAVFDTDHQRALEQTVLLLSRLDHKPAAPRLVELLTHDHPDVFISAAWGLRMLAVKDVLPAMLELATQRTELMLESPPNVISLSLQLGHLFEAFGVMGYREAEELLRRYPPRGTMSAFTYARCGAIWSLGHFYDGQVDEGLASLFVERLHDTNRLPPEDEPVRYMCAVALGRMKAKSKLDDLKKYSTGRAPSEFTEYACAWSISQIDGSELPEPFHDVRKVGNWFLEPIAH